MSQETKKVQVDPFKFYKETLGNPQKILAPMVDGSDITFRRLVRRHGVELCYTPMVQTKMFVESKKSRQELLRMLDEKERPIIIQIVGSDASDMRRSAAFLQKYCDAIDINLGCPQKIAQKGNYGAYLAQDFNKTKEIVTAVVGAVDIPVYCKIRVFDDEKKTLEFVDMLVGCGIKGLCVHGRTIDEKQSSQYHARWPIITKIKERCSIPVIANGGISTIADMEKCKEETHADGFMVGMGLLLNPGMFEGNINNNVSLAYEYLEIAREMSSTHEVTFSYVRGHLIKMLLYAIKGNNELLKEIGTARTLDDCEKWIERVESLTRKRPLTEVEKDNK